MRRSTWFGFSPSLSRSFMAFWVTFIKKFNQVISIVLIDVFFHDHRLTGCKLVRVPDVLIKVINIPTQVVLFLKSFRKPSIMFRRCYLSIPDTAEIGTYFMSFLTFARNVMASSTVTYKNPPSIMSTIPSQIIDVFVCHLITNFKMMNLR